MLELPTREDIPENAFTVSRSRIATWHRCQYKHFLNYGLERRTHSSPAMMKGTLIHEMADEFYQLWIGQPVNYVDMSVMGEIIDRIYEKSAEEHKTLALQAGTVMLRYPEYAAIHDDFIPLGTEVETFAPLGMDTPDGRPIYLHIIIDLLVEQDGSYGIMDHKSGTQFWKPETAYFDNQLAFYIVAATLLGLPVDFSVINNINTYTYKGRQPLDKLFARQYVYRNKMNIAHYLDNLKATIRQILNLKTFVKNLDQHCAYCPYRDVCDTELRGLDSTGVLEVISMSEYTLDLDLGLVDEL